MKKILIVEDEPAYLQLLHDQLTARGYEVIDAKNGFEGLETALEVKPDLILLDIIMPKLSGLKMLDILRTFQWGEKVPVFLLTNVSGSKEESEAMSSRASQYLVKTDVKLDNLMDTIRVFLQNPADQPHPDGSNVVKAVRIRKQEGSDAQKRG